jgi:hypothetical protein
MDENIVIFQAISTLPPKIASYFGDRALGPDVMLLQKIFKLIGTEIS